MGKNFRQIKRRSQNDFTKFLQIHSLKVTFFVKSNQLKIIDQYFVSISRKIYFKYNTRGYSAAKKYTTYYKYHSPMCAGGKIMVKK